jgi:hypothetical protein
MGNKIEDILLEYKHIIETNDTFPHDEQSNKFLDKITNDLYVPKENLQILSTPV